MDTQAHNSQISELDYLPLGSVEWRRRVAALEVEWAHYLHSTYVPDLVDLTRAIVTAA